MRTSAFPVPVPKSVPSHRGALNRLGMRATSIDMLRGNFARKVPFAHQAQPEDGPDRRRSW